MNIGRLVLVAAGAATAAPSLALEGKAVYIRNCAACHAIGLSGAPRFGDRAAWDHRLRAGVDGLMTTVLRGKGAMPPKGGNAGLTDAEIKAAVDYMISAVR